MLDAYRGTIDEDGETFNDALAEVNAFFAGEHGGQPLLMMSYLALVDTHVVGACLTGEWRERQLPIIAYVMTSANWKKRGIGRQLVGRVLKVLNENGYPEVRAVITEGNKPSENSISANGLSESCGYVDSAAQHSPAAWDCRSAACGHDLGILRPCASTVLAARTHLPWSSARVCVSEVHWAPAPAPGS